MSPGALHLIRATKAAAQKVRRDSARSRLDCTTCCTRPAEPGKKRCAYCAGQLTRRGAKRVRDRRAVATVSGEPFAVCCQAFGGHRAECRESRST